MLMKRLSTAVKRRKNLGSTNQMHRFWKGTVKKARRMKSFATEEQAKAWGKEQKLDAKLYTLREHQGGKWQWHKKNKRLE